MTTAHARALFIAALSISGAAAVRAAGSARAPLEKLPPGGSAAVLFWSQAQKEAGFPQMEDPCFQPIQ